MKLRELAGKERLFDGVVFVIMSVVIIYIVEHGKHKVGEIVAVFFIAGVVGVLHGVWLRHTKRNLPL